MEPAGSRKKGQHYSGSVGFFYFSSAIPETSVTIVADSCMAIITDNVLIAQKQNLEAAMSKNPKIQEMFRKIIREELLEARAQLMSQVPLQSDPRNAKKSIRTSVYKKILGGQINILHNKKAHYITSYTPPRTLIPGQRGGNRRKRSARTRQIQQYGSLDRGFILRFINSGTRTRVAAFRNTVGANQDVYNRTVARIAAGDKAHTYNRGNIASRNWFSGAAERELGIIAQRISDVIRDELEELMNNQ